MAGKASRVSGGTISRSSAATAAELHGAAAPVGPVLDTSAEHRMDFLACGRDDAGGDRGAGSTRADRDDRPVFGQVVEALADDAIRDVPRAFDVTLVSLRLLPHVEHLCVPVREDFVELLDL